jgi:hypothetical protein
MTQRNVGPVTSTVTEPMRGMLAASPLFGQLAARVGGLDDDVGPEPAYVDRPCGHAAGATRRA